MKDFCSNAESAKYISNIPESLDGKYTRGVVIFELHFVFELFELVIVFELFDQPSTLSIDLNFFSLGIRILFKLVFIFELFEGVVVFELVFFFELFELSLDPL